MLLGGWRIFIRGRNKLTNWISVLQRLMVGTFRLRDYFVPFEDGKLIPEQLRILVYR